MHHRICSLIICSLTVVALLTSAAPIHGQSKQNKKSNPANANIEIHRDLVYAKVGDMNLHVDLYLPKTRNADTRLIVWIHGGGWRHGNKNRCPLTWLTAHNYAVASVQYRLTDKAIFPAQIHDCKSAIRYLRTVAKKYNFNATNIGVAGISAGGHLVALLGTSGDVKELEGTVGGNVGGNLDQSSRVQAVLDMCGPSDFILRFNANPKFTDQPNSPVYQLFGGPVIKNKALAQSASPAFHVTKDDAPLLIFHGEKDPLVSINQSKHLRDIYKKANLEVTLEPIPGGGHVPKEFWDKTHRDMTVKFFSKHLRK